MILSLVVFWRFGLEWQTLAILALTWALVALSLIDFDHQILPDSILLPFLWLGMVLSLFSWSIDPGEAILGAAVGYMALWSVYQLFKLITGKEGMGYGDFKLLALFGAWGGATNLLQIILLSSVVGAVLGGILIAVMGRR
jgi:leader peptidase (prepilin peptidase)/N-methyltransferase